MTPTIRRFMMILLTAVLLIGGFAVLPGRAQTPAYAQGIQTPTPGPGVFTISVTGSGSATAQPDVAYIDLGVQTDAQTASAALSQNSTQMQGVIDALQKAGVAQADIRTQSVQLYPRYSSQPEQPNTQPQAEATPAATPVNRLLGYTAANTVEVTVRNLANLGSLLDQAVTAGGNTIQGIRFDLSDPTKATDQARQSAMSDATHKAQQLATLANVKLGPVIAIQETSNSPIPFAAADMRAGAAAVPVSPGSQTVTLNVNVTWAIQQ